MLDTQPVGRHASTSARTSRARCAAPTSCSPRSRSTAGDDPEFNVRALRVPGRLRHRADGLDRRRLRRADRARRGARRRRGGAQRRGAAARPPAQAPQVASTPEPQRAHEPQRCCSSRTSTSPACNTLDVYERRGGYEALRKALAMPPRGGRSTSSRPPACAAAAAPASRWARRSRSCPRARWTSTSSATPTSPSPGTFKDRELMQKSPHMLIEGIDHRRLRGAASTARSSTSAASTSCRPTSSTPAIEEARGAGYLGERILGSDHSLTLVRAPRRGRLHLRRGDRRCSTRSRASAATRA